MLSYIHIKNIAIIDELEIDFNTGLNVLTGETGVGKSIIINAINFTIGARTSRDIIREGAEIASAEMIFTLSPDNANEISDTFGIEIEQNDIVISRSLNRNGKNIFKVNGSIVSSNVMKDITSRIIDIHGQHEHQSLFDVSRHIFILDSFAKKQIKDKKILLVEKYDEYKNICKEITKRLGDDNERERKLDLLSYQIDEISNAKLKVGEDIELEARRKVIMNSDKIAVSLNNAYELVSQGEDSISRAIHEMEKIINLDSDYQSTYDTLQENGIIVSEIRNDISGYLDNVSYDPREQEMVEERLDLIDKLKRKYGQTIEDIFRYKESIEKELDDITNNEEILEKLKNDRKKSYDELEALATEVSDIRKENAKMVSEKIESNLKDLEMKNAIFKIKVDKKETIDSDGFDDVEFLFSSNLGENPKELDKIASGGEISRVMLAIKNVLALDDQIQVLIFDEIDTGISGKAAQAVAEKMNELAREHQIICITHLPQIAAMADYHYQIEKIEKEERTVSNIKLLNEEEEINEIARLITGAKMTDMARMHAKELKEQAKEMK